MEVISEINRGGFGVVEKVRLSDGSIVARKSFAPTVGISDPNDLDKLRHRFEREVRYMSSIESEAICPVLDYDLNCSDPWFTMPLAEETLHDAIDEAKSNGTIPVEALADVLNGLEEIHRLGFVHRDLKPMNVLFIDGIWKLADFGLILPPSGETTMLTTASAWGTESYAAPEQALAFHTATEAADIYAFGCILHDIFVASPRIPFAKQSASGRIGAIIERCTDKNPNKRFKSVGALREALTSAIPDANDENEHISDAAEDWVSAVENCTIKDPGTFNDLNRYIAQEADSDERHAIFHAVTESTILELHSLDEAVWKEFFTEYCIWAEDSGFEFSFCDTLVQRLARIFELADVEMKAAAIVSAAQMAKSHNRWFAMGKVVSMAGTDLDEDVAERLAIDIRALGLKSVFRSCADRINKKTVVYHPIVRRALGGES